MKLTSVASPHQVKQVTTDNTAAKARAVAKLTQSSAPQQVQQSPVHNPTNVSPEELSAITPNIPAPQIDASTTTVETQAEAPSQSQDTQQEPKLDKASSEYQLLARKERQLRAKFQQEQQKIKAEAGKWQQEKQELQKQIDELRQNTIPRSRLKDQAYQVLEEEGITYDSLTEQAISAQQRNPRYEAYINKLESKLASMEEKITGQEKAAQEAQTQQYQAAVKQIRADVNDLVKSDQNFETIRTMRAQKDVVELIERTFNEEGRLMSVEEAAEEVENYLVDEYSKLAGLEKIKKRLQSSAQARGTDKQTPKQPPQQQPMKTLTNATSSSRTLSARERALLAFKGQLK